MSDGKYIKVSANPDKNGGVYMNCGSTKFDYVRRDLYEDEVRAKIREMQRANKLETELTATRRELEELRKSYAQSLNNSNGMIDEARRELEELRELVRGIEWKEYVEHSAFEGNYHASITPDTYRRLMEKVKE